MKSESRRAHFLAIIQRYNDSPELKAEVEAANQSLYRRWWECLCLSPNYKRALEGELGEPWAGMALDFGQLYDQFNLWWLARGRYLFADHVYTPAVNSLACSKTTMEFEADSADQLSLWMDTGRPTLYVSIPLTLERRHIDRQLDQLITQAQSQTADAIERLRHPKRTFYPDQRIRVGTIDTLLRVWRARNETDKEWWEIGEQEKLRDQFTCNDKDDEDIIKRKRRMMTLTVQRYYKMAAAMIEFAAQGDFPRVK